MKKKILIVDDSATIQKLLFSYLSKEPDFEIVGICSDPFEAKSYIVNGPIDCMILDLELPKMDGLTFLKKVMSIEPLPIVILSGAIDGNTQLKRDLLLAGAADVFSKPNGITPEFFSDLAHSIRKACKTVVKTKTPAKVVKSTLTGRSTCSAQIQNS